MTARIDHLIWAAPDLASGVEEMQELLGTELIVGGVHPQWGTKNYLGSLGTSVYIEVIGPDPEQDVVPGLWGIAELTGPRLATWCATGVDLHELTRRAVASGVPIGEVRAGSRATPDGRTLTWTLTDPSAVICGGVIPFFIDWGDTPHPAGTTPRVGELEGLRVEYSDPDRVHHTFAALGIDGIEVAEGPRPHLTARIRTESGVVEVS